MLLAGRSVWKRSAKSRAAKARRRGAPTVAAVERLEGRTLLTATGAPVVESVTPAAAPGCGVNQFSQVKVVFDEAVTSASASDVRNYRFAIENSDGSVARFVTIDSAVLGPDGKTVTLSFAPQTTGAFRVHVGGIIDLAGQKSTELDTRGYDAFTFTQSRPQTLVLGRFNNDEWIDAIAARNTTDGVVYFHAGRPDGGFDPATTTVFGGAGASQRSKLTAADVDGDGKLDLVVPETGSLAGVAVYFGLGNGTFEPTDAANPQPTRFLALADVTDVAAADVDRDGDVDLVATGTSSGLKVFLNNGSRSIATWGIVDPDGASPGFGARDVHLADVNGDGRLDAIGTGLADARVWLNGINPNGTPSVGLFSAPIALPVGGGDTFESSDVADVDGDGKLDIVTGFNRGVVLFNNDDRNTAAFEGFLPPASLNLPHSGAVWSAADVTAADFDGDGRIDVVGGQRAQSGLFDPNLRFAYGAGGRTFATASLALPVASASIAEDVREARQIEIADLDRDGLMDIVLADSSRNHLVVLTSRLAPPVARFTFAPSHYSGPPTLDLNAAVSDNQAAVTIGEGGAVTASGKVHICGPAADHVVRITWGDGTTSTSADGGVTVDFVTGDYTATHVYADGGVALGTAYEVVVTLFDEGIADGAANGTVTVENLPPLADPLAISTPRVEGTEIIVTGSATDPAGAADPLTFTWQVYKGATLYRSAAGADLTEFRFTPDDDGTYRIALTVSDGDGGFATTETTFTVANVAPTPTIASIGPVRVEGTSIAVSGSAADPAGANDTITFAWAVYKDDAATPFATGTGADWSFTPDDDGSYHIVLTASDEDGGTANVEQTISAANVAPTADAGLDRTVAEGSPVTLTGSFSDPGVLDTHALSWSVVASNGQIISAGSGPSFNFVPNDNGTYTVTFTVADDDGGFASDSVLVTVTNADPSATLSNSGSVTEGSTATVSFSNASDPSVVDAASLRYFFSLSASARDAATYGDGAAASSADFAFADNGTYLVYGRVLDKDGGFRDYITTVVVNNVAPSPTLTVTTPAGGRKEGSSIAATITATDPAGANDPLTYTWVVYRGSDASGAIVASGTGTAVAFTPTDNGTFYIAATVADDDGGSATVGEAVTVSNVAPTVNAGADQTVAEGSAVSLIGSFSDPGADDTHTLSWTVVASNGQIIAAGNGLTFDFVPNDNGCYTVTLTVTDDDGGIASDSVVVTVTNVAPTATIASIGSIRVEGSSIAVSGSATDPAGANDTISYAWAVYKDGSATPFATGAGANWSFLPTDNGSYRIVLAVSDEDGGSATAEQTISVTNVAPTVTIAGPAVAVRGRVATFTGSFTDPGSADTHPSRTWTVKNSSGAVVSSGSGSSFDFTPIANGVYTVTFAVTDDDGGVGTASTSLEVRTAAVLVDPLSPTVQSLFIAGTSGSDVILVGPIGGGRVEVFVNGAFLGPFTFAGRIVIDAGAGADLVTVLDGHDAWIDGGAGDDLLMGGSGDDVILGGDGDDLLVGGSGRDLLIGGNGADRIVGNADDDILIAGRLAFANPDVAIAAVMKEWTRTDANYSTRVSHLRGQSGGGLNGTYYLITDDDSPVGPATVGDDASGKDILTGSSGSDWFLFRGGEDRVTDLHRDEAFANDLEWILTAV